MFFDREQSHEPGAEATPDIDFRARVVSDFLTIDFGNPDQHYLWPLHVIRQLPVHGRLMRKAAIATTFAIDYRHCSFEVLLAPNHLEELP